MDKLFLERYADYVNKTPLIKNLEESIFQYINLYNKIQQLHALYFKNLKMVDEAFVQSLDNYKDDIQELKTAHGKLVILIKSELLSYYTLTHQLTDVLREIYSCVTELSKQKHRFLEQSILSTKQKIEIMFHLVNNVDYKKLVTKLLMNLSRFDKLAEKRNLHCNHIMLLIDAVKTCEEDLINGYDINQYDLMVSVNNPKFMKYIEAQVSFHNKLISDLSGLETTLKTKAFPKLWEVISEFKRDHRIDPNYAIEDVSESSFRDTFNRYLKISKAIQSTIGSLQREEKELNNRDKLVNPHYATKSLKPIALKRGWQLKHPKIVKMVAERDLLSDLLHEKRNVKLPLKTKEIEFCIQENDTEYGWCKNQAGGGVSGGGKKKVKKNKKSKASLVTDKAKKLVQGYLDYSQLLSALSANKSKYAQVLTELYQVRDALNKNEYINALDNAVNQLQNQADRVRLTKIMAAQHEADYQDYIRQLTEDNPMLAKIAEKNQYANFIMKKGKSSQEEYYNELDADNRDNIERRSKQIMTSVHKENLLKDTVKSMIYKEFQSRAGQSVFDVAGTDNRYLSYGGGIDDLNPIVFNAFALISNTEQCLQVMKMGKDEIVNELKTMLKLRYNGDELKRYLAKVDIIANRVMDVLKKDKCTIPYQHTITSELAERYIKLGCTLKCLHLDALHAANLKGGLIGRQVHQCFGFIVKRLIDVECPRLVLISNELSAHGKPDKLDETINDCIYEAMTTDGFLESSTLGVYKISNTWLQKLNDELGIDVHDLPNNVYKSAYPADLAYLVKDIEKILRRVTWSVRDHVDRSQKDAIEATIAKQNVEQCCTHLHKYAKEVIVKTNADEMTKLNKLFTTDKKYLETRKDYICMFIRDSIASIQGIKDNKDLANIILDIHDSTARNVPNDSEYSKAVNELNKWFNDKTNKSSKSKTLTRLYTYYVKNRPPLHELIQEDDYEDFKELVEKFSKIIIAHTNNNSEMQNWWKDADDAKKEVENLKKSKIEGYSAGEPVPVVLSNLIDVLALVDTKRYEIQCTRESKKLDDYNTQAKTENYAADIKKYIDAYTRAHEVATTEHKKCTEATNSIATKIHTLTCHLYDVLKIFRHFNRGVICLINVSMPPDKQITCAKATVGNNMNITSLVELGRRLNAIANKDTVSRRLLDCDALLDAINKLRKDWVANLGEVQTNLEIYTAKSKSVIDKEKEIKHKNPKEDLLKYVTEGIQLDKIGELLKLQGEKESAEDLLRLSVHKLEKEANEYHRNISKSFSRYHRMISVETDHLALLNEIIKFIETWNQCYQKPTAENPVDLLLKRITTKGYDDVKQEVCNLIKTEINKYAGECTSDNNIHSALKTFIDPTILDNLLHKAERK